MRAPSNTLLATGILILSLAGYRTALASAPRQQTSATPQADAAVKDMPDLTKAITGAAVRCDRGKAKGFDCHNVDLLSFLPVSAIGDSQSVAVNGMWGWIDSATGREFAIVGRWNGASFVEVTDPINPKYLGDLPLHEGARASRWRDMKVYKNHAFVVADGAKEHGIQIFDLTQLRQVKNPPVQFQETARYADVHSVHTVVLNEETGFLYAAGTSSGGNTCGGGLHMVDVRNPTVPTFAGCYTETGYVHDAQCVIYRGPDAQYKNREICLNASGKVLGIVDVTDKAQPKTIATVNYPNAAYTHQGWFAEGQRYFFLNDEFDEVISAKKNGPDSTRTRTMLFDLNDLDDPVLASVFLGSTPATDHNLYIQGRYMYQTNYEAGFRLIDVSDPKNPKEIGYFDTYPKSNGSGWDNGAFTSFPYFKNGVIGVTSKKEGLFLLRYRNK